MNWYAEVAAPVAVPPLSEWLSEPAWLAEPAMTEGPSMIVASVGRSGVRYLARQSLQDLFHAYQGQAEAGKAAPYTTFLRVFRNWRHTLASSSQLSIPSPRIAKQPRHCETTRSLRNNQSIAKQREPGNNQSVAKQQGIAK